MAIVEASRGLRDATRSRARLGSEARVVPSISGVLDYPKHIRSSDALGVSRTLAGGGLVERG